MLTITVRDAATLETHLVIIPTLGNGYPERVADIHESWARGNQWAVTVEDEPSST